MASYEATRLKSVPFSGIRRIMGEAMRLESAGASIIHLEIGRPDFDTPDFIKAAAKAALDRGDVHYTHSLGNLSLRCAIAQKLSGDNGLSYDPENEVMVTVGASEAIFVAAAAFLNPDEEMLAPDPGWTNYQSVPGLLCARTVAYQTHEANSFRPDIAGLAAAITPRTKMLVLLSPGNPSGTVMDAETLAGIADLARKHDLLVLSDEIYEKLVYDGARHISIASLPGMRERTIVVNGFSKSYSMTGWRLGYLVAPQELMPSMLKVHQNVTLCASSIAQAGGLAALEGPQDCVSEMVAEFKRRRDLLVPALNQMPGLHCVMPQGAFYVFVNIRALGMTSEDVVMYLLREAGVATVPGGSFGPGGEGYIRLSYANSYGNIEEALVRMERALRKL
jgi:aminotransferase